MIILQNFLPVISYNFPQGISIKELAHLASIVKLGKFQRFSMFSLLTKLLGRFADFDYVSPIKNRAVYGISTPPDFLIGNINIKVGIYYGIYDNLISHIVSNSS